MENVSEWTVVEVKEWAKEHYGDEISDKFESKWSYILLQSVYYLARVKHT